MRHLVLLGAIFLFFSCQKSSVDPVTETGNSTTFFYVPQNFTAPVYDVSKNPITNDGFSLGKTLFNDPLLSRDNTISCAECHNQAYAFTHHGHPLSHGIDGKVGIRNALPIQNVAWQKEFFWDGGVNDLDLFPIRPIENPVEMDEKVDNVLVKLRKTSHYPGLFKRAFGSEEINQIRFLKALSQYMNSLISANSKYDKVIRNEGQVFTADEKDGYDLFLNKCANCHKGENFTDLSYRNNGLPIDPKLNDKGRFRITNREIDLYTFKVPNLRNVEASAPYMHDGRFGSLEEVLNHYSNGIVQSATLDPLLKNGMSLSTDEKRKIILFLKTLTDNQFLTDPKFSK
jgi:cytochrome c peroxidase